MPLPCYLHYSSIAYTCRNCSTEQKWIVLPENKCWKRPAGTGAEKCQKCQNNRLLFALRWSVLCFQWLSHLIQFVLLERYPLITDERDCVRLCWMSEMGWGKQQHPKNGSCLQKCHRCKRWCWGDLAVKDWPLICAHWEHEDVIFSSRADLVCEQC